MPSSFTCDCTNKACGGDGCGGSCGSCDSEASCRDGTCVLDESIINTQGNEENNPIGNGRENPQESESTSAITCTDGCLLGDECVEVGYISEGNYCDVNGEFVTQRTLESVCESNFECDSNLCVDNQCISRNVWQRFLNWVKGLFS